MSEYGDRDIGNAHGPVFTSPEWVETIESLFEADHASEDGIRSMERNVRFGLQYDDSEPETDGMLEAACAIGEHDARTLRDTR